MFVSTMFFMWAIKFFNGSNAKSIFDFKKDSKKARDFSSRQSKIEYDKTLIGTNGSKKNIYMANNASHVFICGTTGSGKTVALANFIKSGIEYDYPMLIIDGKGDINENSIFDIVNKLKENKKLYLPIHVTTV